MKLVVHKMPRCKLCSACIVILKQWGIGYREIYDKPIQDRPYPYITIELEYEELKEWVTRGMF